LTKHLKERYIGKPVYDVIVLPFRQEETTETRTIYNTATCLKSTYLVADAVFLVDNQRYVKKDAPAENNLNTINARVVEPFYNMLCAGEETNRRFVGSKTLDAGDIIQTLTGWTVIGEALPAGAAVAVLWPQARLREKMSDTSRAVHAMDQAISGCPMTIDPADVGRAMYLLTAPPAR
jgi:cell division GTPase FtsZ